MTRDPTPPGRPDDVPSSDRVLLLHTAEIGLKGGNRRVFERRLRDRLLEAMRAASLEVEVRHGGGRWTLEPKSAVRDEAAEAFLARAMAVARRVPGVANVAVARVVPAAIEAMQDAAVAALAEAPPGTFKVETRRADKAFPMTSIDVSRAVAPACASRGERRADVHAPDVTVRVEIVRGGAYVSAGRRPGPGGLPVGSGGRMLALLSGGIDSPVAAWMMQRRGARVLGVHFHNRTQQGGAVREKLEDVGRVLAWGAGSFPLLVVPFEACQRAIVAAVAGPYRMLAYRRAMLRIAARLAREERAGALVTGDSLGQVASQTTENLAAVLAVTDLPVHMPLIGMDKTEITERARQIGTFDISIRPGEDCCSFLVPRHPVTACRAEKLDRIEEALDVEGLAEEAAAGVEREDLAPDTNLLPPLA